MEVIRRQYVTLKEAVEITGLSYSTLNRRIRDGTLERIKWSRRILIPINQLMPESACGRR